MTDSAHSCCGHQVAVQSVQQSLDEMDFERGVWSAALNAETDRINKYLQGGGDANATDSSGYTALVSTLSKLLRCLHCKVFVLK